nr:hypothetical protein [Polymorphobacter sp.]
MEHAIPLAIAALLAATPVLAATPAFSPAETAAIYKGAGFTMKGKTVIGCDATDPGWPRSDFSIEAIDLNNDKKPEAIVSEGNIACYGRDETGFNIMARNPDGTWRSIGSNSGGTLPLKTRHNGWLDIEYGGPGMQKQPVLRFNGKKYQ